MKTKNKIEVSVIIPNYNYGHYIKQCINSVLESEFHHDALEIIIVDDASTDNSINIIEDIQNDTTAKIHLVKQSNNLGLAKSRNAGIKNASGNYLFFLDSDNYIGKSCLKTHYDFLSKNDGYTACYAPIQKFDDRSARMLNVFSNLEYDYDKLLYGNYIDAMSMIKKEDLIKLGSYDEEMPYSGWEDYELWLRMGSRNKKIYFIDGNPLSYYRIHENSMIRGLQSDKIGALASYVSEKYTVSTMQKNNNTRHTKIQIFWAGAGGVFF
jgi:glycosyltransferase involved in cell wall biosynthesis